MNHLTNVYKHKCEQLQEQIYNLTRMLNEAIPPGRVPRIRVPNTPDAPGFLRVPAGLANIVPPLWRTLLSRSRGLTPAQVADMISKLTGDAKFMKWWNNEYGVIREVNGRYIRLLNGEVHTWNNGTWEIINKPGTRTPFGYIAPDGQVIKPHIWNPFGQQPTTPTTSTSYGQQPPTTTPTTIRPPSPDTNLGGFNPNNNL